MIALVGVAPPAKTVAGVAELDALPVPPAAGYTAALINCGDSSSVLDALKWYDEVRAYRPSFVIGLIARPSDAVESLGACVHPVYPVLTPADVEGGRVSESALRRLRSNSVLERVVEELTVEFELLSALDLASLRAVVEVAMSGCSVPRAAACLGMSREAFRRRLSRVGMSPGMLLREIRLRAYHVRIEEGETKAAARLAGGWLSSKAFSEFNRRARSRIAAGPD